MQGDSTAEKKRFASTPVVYQFPSGKEERDFSAVSGVLAESDLTCVLRPSAFLGFHARLAVTGEAGVVLFERVSRVFPLARDSKEMPGSEGSA